MCTRITYPKSSFSIMTASLASATKSIPWRPARLIPYKLLIKNRLLTAPNANPIILDARGEANIYTGQAVQLVFTAPGASITSPIVSVDYVGEQQNAVMVSGNAIPGTMNNNYKLVLVPALTSIPPNLTVVMTPDVTNSDTLVTPTVFTGTGINDALFSGPYNGDVAGAIFQVEIDGVYIPVPGTAPTLAEYVTAGLVTAGNHSIVYTYVTANGESGPSPASNVINSAGSGTTCYPRYCRRTYGHHGPKCLHGPGRRYDLLSGLHHL